MKNFRWILIIIVIVVIQACNPGGLVKKEKPEDVKSTLYYEQKSISDPFIDSLQLKENQKATLSTLLIPPPPPPAPRMKKAEGYRIQLFAGLDSLQALIIKKSLSGQTQDSLYMLVEKGLHKIQLGDYLYRPQADSARRVLRTDGFPGAWVVKRMINIPNTIDSKRSKDGLKDSVAVAGPEIESPYKIQLMALSDEAEVLTRIAQIKNQIEESVFYQKVNSLFKIYVGPYKTRGKADKTLQKVRNAGFPDAWVVFE